MVIRELTTDAEPLEYERLARLLSAAYPVMAIDEPPKLATLAADLARFNGDEFVRWVVAEDDRQLVGAMRLYDYTMNVRGRDDATGGVGAVAVALDRKREGIARNLITWYLDWYRSRGATFAILHPFRPDFYRALGFGYGTPMHRYRFSPSTLRASGATGRARRLDASDLDALLACCDRVRSRTNGLIAKHRAPTERVLSGVTPSYVGIEDDGRLTGFMQTSVKLGPSDTANTNELLARDLHFENRGAFAALLGYLAAQRDQFARVVIESQDDALFLVSDDPRDGSDRAVAPPAAHRASETGLGVMYRILDVPAAFAHLAPRARQASVLRVVVSDDFYAATAGTWTFTVSDGAVREAGAEHSPDATLHIGSADLASLVVGSLDLRTLVRHGLATLEPEASLDDVTELFRATASPRCETRF